MPHHYQGTIYRMLRLCFAFIKAKMHHMSPHASGSGGGDAFASERKKSHFSFSFSLGQTAALNPCIWIYGRYTCKDYKNIHYLQPWSALLGMEIITFITLLAAKLQNDASEGVHSPSDNPYAHSLTCAVLSHTDIDTDLHSQLCAC